MYISPPIIVLGIVSLSLIGVAVLKPERNDEVKIFFILSKATYTELLLMRDTHPNMDGRSIEVGQIVRLLVEKRVAEDTGKRE